MSRWPRRIAVGVARGLVGTVRLSLYVVLLLVGRVLIPLTSLIIVGGMIIFAFCLLFLRDHTGLIIAGACMALAGIALQVFYDAALRLVAPDGVVVVRDV
jgi:inner membrane protein involved in colicin E2 resistance